MNKVVSNIKRFWAKNSRTILTVAAAAGTVATVFFTARDSFRAKEVIDEKIEEGADNKEIIKAVIPCYIATGISMSATIAAIISSHSVASEKISAYSGAYYMAADAAKTYRDKVKDFIGEEKAKEIDRSVAKDEVDRKNSKKSSDSDTEIIISDGDVRCYDRLSGRYFSSSMNKLLAIQNEINFSIINESWESLNDYYDRIGLEPIGLGEELGWSDYGKIEMKFDSFIADDGVPTLAVEFDTMPMPDTLRRY